MDEWKSEELEDIEVTNSLVWGWWFLEFLPIKRLLYSGAEETSR